MWLWRERSQTHWPTAYCATHCKAGRTGDLGGSPVSCQKKKKALLHDDQVIDDPKCRSLQTPFFVLHVTLWSADRTQERNIISNPPKCTRVLMGSLVSSPSLLKNPQGEQGLYFAFPDLSIRTEGQYTLRFSLIKLIRWVWCWHACCTVCLHAGFSSDFQPDAKSKIIAQVFSDPFTVYSAKKVQTQSCMKRCVAIYWHCNFKISQFPGMTGV